MAEKIDSPVSVSFAYNHEKGQVYPKWLLWNGRLYAVSKVGLHHTYREGRTLYHVFSVVSKNTFFRLLLDTQTLHWKLEEISDALTD